MQINVQKPIKRHNLVPTQNIEELKKKNQFYPLIPIFDIFVNEENENDIRAELIPTNNFHYIQRQMNGRHEVTVVDYDIFLQDQLYTMQYDEKLKELEEEEKLVHYSEDPQTSEYNPEEEMTTIRANDLYAQIMFDWDNIGLARRTGDFAHDWKLDMEQSDYFNKIVYERAWECYDIMTTLIEGGYQHPNVFANYKEIYEKIQKTKPGSECARMLNSLARLMSRCVTAEVIQQKETIIEAIMPRTSNIPHK